MTGFTSLASELVPKQLGPLREVVPKAALVGLLVNPNNPDAASVTKAVEAAARGLGVQILALNAASDDDIDKVFTTLVARRADAIVVGNDAFFNRRAKQLAMLAERHALPAIYGFREYVVAGGLMSYGSSLAHECHQAGIYVGRILKGEKPGDLPVQQPTKFDLVVNLRTAKALRLDLPLHIQQLANEVVE